MGQGQGGASWVVRRHADAGLHPRRARRGMKECGPAHRRAPASPLHDHHAPPGRSPDRPSDEPSFTDITLDVRPSGFGKSGFSRSGYRDSGFQDSKVGSFSDSHIGDA